MPKIYILGPMRRIKHQNFPAFDRAKAFLSAAGWQVISPADITRLYEGWGKYPPADFKPTHADMVKFMRQDCNVLFDFEPSNGDAVFVLNGWRDSLGGKVEIALAECLGLLILYENDCSHLLTHFS